MATTKDALMRLGSEEELLYWAKKNNIRLVRIPGGYVVEEHTILLNKGYIVSVERTLHEPREL